MMNLPQTQQIIREILANEGEMADAATLSSSQNLYSAGLTSFCAVQTMIALEQKFDIKFPDPMLKCQCFSSIDAITRCLAEIHAQLVAA